MTAQQYGTLIQSTMQQLQHVNILLQRANAEDNENLAMHLDLKAAILLSVVASYECAIQMAIANERVAESMQRIRIV